MIRIADLNASEEPENRDYPTDLVLPNGKAMREHSVQGEMTLLCIEGEIELSTPGATRRLRAGQLVHLAAGEPHALLALSDASALLTICLAAP